MRRHLSNARPCQAADGNAAAGNIPFGRETAVLLVLGLLLFTRVADVEAAADAASGTTTEPATSSAEAAAAAAAAALHTHVTRIGDARTMDVNSRSGIAVDNIVVVADDDENGNNNSSQSEPGPSTTTSSTSSASASATGSTPHQQHIPLVRLPSNTLLKYSAYKDVSILHFRIPLDTRTAVFSFKAIDESKSFFQRHCAPRNVSLHLKAGSYPVISPENITFPQHFLSADQRFEIHDLQFESDGSTKRLTVDGPQPGNWFAVAYISWTDPKHDHIEQQGLASSCETLLLSEMAVVQTSPVILSPTLWYNGTVHGRQPDVNGTTATTPSDADTYKFFVPRTVNAVLVHIRVHSSACSGVDCAELLVRVQANALPSTRAHLQSTVLPVANQSAVTVDFYPHQDAWHYLDVGYLALDESVLGAQSVDDDAYADSDDGDAVDGADDDGGAAMRHNDADKVVASEDLDEVANDDDNSSSDGMGKQTDDAEFNATHRARLGAAGTATAATNDVQYSVRVEFVHEGERIEDVAADAELSTAELNKDLPQRNFEYHPLLRQTWREFFMFDYDLLPDHNGTVPAYLNVTGGQPTGFRFKLGDVYDIGGTLTFVVVLRDTIRENVRFRTGPMMSTTATTTTTKTSGATAAEQSVNTLSGGAVAEKLVAANAAAEADATPALAVNKTAALGMNQTLIVCMRLGEPGIPQWPDQCVYGRTVLPAAIIINNTDTITKTGLVHVPFPESGEWFITMGLFCVVPRSASGGDHVIDSVKEFLRSNAGEVLAPLETKTTSAQRPCPCAERAAYLRECVRTPSCLAALNETETLRIKECLMDARCTERHAELERLFEAHHRLATSTEGDEQRASTLLDGSSCNASTMFTISSSPCVTGRCGQFGRCYHYMSGGFVFSTCLCGKGYRGWDCTEDTQVPSGWSIITALLLLTLSNLLFIPSIWFAVRRKYYTEAVIYFFAMFFSIFYHACDSGEEEYNYCLVKIGVLQFCDFYCGLLAIWVTLIAMAHVRPTFVSLLHMFGAIVLAFGTELNKQSLWVFLAPALTGICIISVSWGLRCRRTRSLFPSKRYLAVFLPVGAVLVMVGLVCYAFLQTRQNYHIVHSVWHMVMALSILCLLPGRQSFLPKC